MRTHFRKVLLVSALIASCGKAPSASPERGRPDTPAHAQLQLSSRAVHTGAATAPRASAVAESAPAPVVLTPEPTKEQVLRFRFCPKGAPEGSYELNEPDDQHRVVIPRGLASERPNLLIALHGQPRRGQAPRDYGFPKVVTDVVRTMIESEEIEPIVLVLPTFRFLGQNWPNFSLPEFLRATDVVLARVGLTVSQPYVVGHSGAAGCGGGGLNRVHEVAPKAVGFLDTCVGPTFIDEAKQLERNEVPTLIIHSVETAGFRPRQPTEYSPHFDFGKVYRPIGLAPIACPQMLPDVPLRTLEYRCAASANGTTTAFVIDTGEGEAAHNAVVPVGLRYFLRMHFAKPHKAQ